MENLPLALTQSLEKKGIKLISIRRASESNMHCVEGELKVPMTLITSHKPQDSPIANTNIEITELQMQYRAVQVGNQAVCNTPKPSQCPLRKVLHGRLYPNWRH